MNFRTRILIVIIVVAAVVVGSTILWKQLTVEPRPIDQITQPPNPVKVESKMKLTSLAFENNGMIPQKYTCDEENVSPPLSITEMPDNAKSLVLVVDDPDAPSGDWVHWTIWNIDPKTTEITEGSVPQNTAQGLTDFGKAGWGGPCPPSGIHHYQFKLYALDATLTLSSSAKKKDIEAVMEGHILDQTLLVGLYQRD